MSANNHTSICFVAPNAYPILVGDRTISTVGGAEVQQCIIARGLASLGYRVSMVCLDFGQPDGLIVDGVKIFKAYNPSSGLPGLRFFYPRIAKLWGAMKRANADVYYQRTSAMLTGLVAAYCTSTKRKFIFAAAHDKDFSDELPLVSLKRDKIMYRWGIDQADAVVVQNAQQIDLAAKWGLKAQLIPSCFFPPSDAVRNEQGCVLWVSTIRAWKRPEFFLRLAKKLPDIQFRMVGGPGYGEESLFDAIKTEAKKIPNLKFVGFVPHADIESEFNSARVFVNTSISEGFPNTFLQAWSRSIPTVSFFKTNSLIGGHDVEMLVDTEEDLAHSVAVLMSSDFECARIGENANKYFMSSHSVNATVLLYSKLINEIVCF